MKTGEGIEKKARKVPLNPETAINIKEGEKGGGPFRGNRKWLSSMRVKGSGQEENRANKAN